MKTTQRDFRAAIFDPDRTIPESLTDGQERPAGKRFNVYRNNVVMGLKEALSESFPVIGKLLGAQNFASLAGLYLRAHPPSDPRMMLYGTDFPAFLESFAPLSHLAYLPDVARLELARRHSYHAADANPIDPTLFTELAPEKLASALVRFAPSVRVIRSPWPVLDIWHYNMSEGAPQPQANGQDVLVTRPEFDPRMDALPKGGALLVETLAKGTRLGPALDLIEAKHPAFDFPTLLALLIQTGAIAALTPET
ncbi:MAG: DNA-binding domain-containing protein [Planktotalea sp.]|uniref:HvfC/BufC family peptide modification chaperone n=1 Tax=Planktotalea sp. TaxID=2029877 RepID=UPI003C784410